MTLDESVHGMRLGVIERAQVLGNVSAVCRELNWNGTASTVSILAAGAYFLEKPFSPPGLARKVREGAEPVNRNETVGCRV